MYSSGGRTFHQRRSSGRRARRRRAPRTAAVPSSRGCGGTRSPDAPSSRSRSGRSRRLRAGRTPARTCRPAGPGRAGNDAGRDLAPERCRGLDRERIRGDVLRAEIDRLRQRAPPRLDRLAVRAVDEIEVHVAVPRDAGVAERAADRRRLVDPLERGEHRGVERLGAHRQPVETRSEQRLELRSVDRVGVRLDRDLGVVGDVEPVSQVREQTLQVDRVERRRRPAAQEHGREVLVSPGRRGQRGLSEDRPHVTGRQVVEPGVRVEVAVAAAREAERHVDVDPGAHRFSSFGAWSTRSAAMNASCGTSTRPTRRMRALPFFCCSRSLRLRVMSPP